jgi:hypothetical protein
MILESLIGAAIGAAVGVLTAILPGTNKIGATVATAAITAVVPAAAPVAIATSYCVATALGSAKEAIDPTVSGDETVAASAPEQVVDAEKMCRSIYTSKLIGLGCGLGLGYLAGGVLTSLTTSPITLFVVLLLAAVLYSQLKNHWLLITMVLVGTQAFFAMATAAGITLPVYLLGTCIFVIPGLLDKLGKKEQKADRLINAGVLKGEWLPDVVKRLIGVVVSAATPGVSPQLVCLATSKKTNILTQLTSQAAEAGIEGYALYAMLTGTASAKAILGIEIGLGMMSPLILWVVIAAMLLSGLYLKWAFRTYSAIAVCPGLHFVSLCVAVATVIWMGGLVGIVTMVAGIGLSIAMKATSCPRTVGSLLFIGPCLR